MRDQSGKARWALRLQGCCSTAGQEKPDNALPGATYNQRRCKRGLWSPIPLLEMQDSGDSEALPRFLAMPMYSSHLESTFRDRLPVIESSASENMKLSTGHSLKSWTWWLSWVHSSSEYSLILNLNSLSKTVWGSRAWRDSKAECRWNARQWCWGWPCSRALSLALLPMPGFFGPLYFTAVIHLQVNDINICIQM